MNRSGYHVLLRERLDGRLYRHCMGVARMASKIARHYGWNEEKAFLAGALHDYAKSCSPGELLEKAGLLGIEIDPVTRREPGLLHAPVGAAMVKEELGVRDPRVLSAIALHTTGDSGMSRLEKLIYLADIIETGRRYPGVDRLRKLAFIDFNRALLQAVERTILRVIQRGRLMHPRSIDFRNELLLQRQEKSSI